MKTPQPKSPSSTLLAGRYLLGAPLGAGGMGTVFEAHDQLLRRRVAIKRLLPELEADPLARERLRREALAAAALDHPYICQIHEIGEAEGHLFIVMEYVDGDTLQALAGRSLLPLRQVVDLAMEVVEALDEAHRRGVVHRDLKPANIRLRPDGWYGRFFAAQADSVEQARGRAMIEAAATDFHALEMVPHAALAERWLREGATTGPR